MIKLIILQVVIPAISGFLVGTGCGMGIWPIFRQPKNMRIQMTLSILGIVIMAIWIYYYVAPSITNPITTIGDIIYGGMTD